MRGAVLGLLMLAQAHAEASTDKYVDDLVSRALSAGSPQLSKDLEAATIGKPGHLQLQAKKPSQVVARPPAALPALHNGFSGFQPSMWGGSSSKAAQLQLPRRPAGSVKTAAIPPAGSKLPVRLDKALDEHFLGAVPGPVAHERIKQALSEYGFTPTNTIFGTSICPDEINTVKGTMCDLMETHWGSHFPMGGLAGAPYVGKTGYFAFSHHVPDNGNVLVMFGPHMGLTSAGQVGKFLRDGQATESTGCGALSAAYAQILAGGVEDDMDMDMQQTWVRNAVAPEIDRIKAAKNPMVEIAQVTYEAILRKMINIVDTKYGPGYLALVGGITINMPKGFPDYFVPCYFTIQKRGKGPIDNLFKISS